MLCVCADELVKFGLDNWDNLLTVVNQRKKECFICLVFKNCIMLRAYGSFDKSIRCVKLGHSDFVETEKNTIQHC